MARDYSKHKDRDPQETVDLIRNTIEGMGLTLDCAWTSRQYDATSSCRVELAGTSMGTNGKGMGDAYSLASGHAELMERIQNKIIGTRAHVQNSFEKFGFYDHPDERLVAAKDIVSRHDPVIDGWLSGLELNTGEDRLGYLEGLSRTLYHRDDGMLAEVPFCDLSAGELRWLSPAVYGQIYGSNGMAAGNTLEEAMVQGLSEVFERHVKLKVLRGEVTPPQIPHDLLGDWGTAELVSAIEESGRYRVHLFDGSLGQGYPVVLTAIVDRLRGSFGVNVGSHPSFAVAVERTLTEAFQGRDIDTFTAMDSFAPARQTSAPDNLRTMLMVDAGAWPPSLLTGASSWDFVPWEADEGLSNVELLARMVALLRRDGHPLLVRDASHLGFPSCHIIVPGMSEIVALSGACRDRMAAQRAKEAALDRFPQVSGEQVEAILAAEPTSFDRPELLVQERPFARGWMQPQRLYCFLHLFREEFAAAGRCLASSEPLTEGVAALYLRALATYTGWREDGIGHEEALELIRFLFPPALFRRVAADTEPTGMLKRLFPQMSCYDCDSCELAKAGGCGGVAERDAFEKIDAALAKSQVSQEVTLRHLQEVLARAGAADSCQSRL